MDYQEEKVELSEEDVLEINRLLQEAALRDEEDVVEYPGPVYIDPDVCDVTEGWDEFVERVLAEGSPEEEEEV